MVPYQRARLLTLGLPRFGPLAMVAAVVLVAAGALDATLRLTSPQQVLTTPYGRTLFVGFELFLILVAVGGYIGLYLRPRLASELGEESSVGMDEDSTLVRLGASATGAAEDGGATLLMRRGDRLGAATPAKASGAAAGGDEPPLTPRAESLEERIRDWLRRQALLGGALLLCVALIVIFAGSLSPTPASTPITTNATATPFSGQQSVGGLTIQLGITPNISGVNTVTVAVKDAQGKPVSGATVTLAIASTDMDMGVAKPQVQPVASTPGSYSAQATISMAGHWQAAVNVTPPNTSTSVQATFTFSVGFN
jgi:copper transport protein